MKIVRLGLFDKLHDERTKLFVLRQSDLYLLAQKKIGRQIPQHRAPTNRVTFTEGRIAHVTAHAASMQRRSTEKLWKYLKPRELFLGKYTAKNLTKRWLAWNYKSSI